MTRMDLIPQALVDAAMPLWTPEVTQRVFKAELWTKAMAYIHKTAAMQTHEEEVPPKWQKVKAKTTDWDDPTEKDDFIKLSSANHSLSPLEAWAERFVDESMIPKFIARDWNVSHAKSLHDDGYKFAGPVSQVTPNHACVTCMS